MSVESWKQVYYPVPGNTFEGLEINLETVKKALEHSLLKWQGLTENVKSQHEVKVSWILLVPKESEPSFPLQKPLELSSDSCALCALFDVECALCPLKNCNEEYRTFIKTSNSLPMTDLIQSKLKELYPDPT